MTSGEAMARKAARHLDSAVAAQDWVAVETARHTLEMALQLFDAQRADLSRAIRNRESSRKELSR